MTQVYMREYDQSHPIFKHYTRRNNVNYNGQKSMAKKRGIQWEFTFHEWILWWLATGHFDERGVNNHQYQMCRYNDEGPYSPTNTYCSTGYEHKQLTVAFGKPRIPIVYNGVQYRSISDAIKASNMSRPQFYKTVVRGKK